jgi:hypothetical protein
VITKDLISKIEAVWNNFWSGDTANLLEVMEQFTCLLFTYGLNEGQILAERGANWANNR